MPPGNNKNLAACRENNRNITDSQSSRRAESFVSAENIRKAMYEPPSNGGVSESPTLYNNPEMVTSVNFS